MYVQDGRVPGQTSGFRAAFRPDSNPKSSKSTEIKPGSLISGPLALKFGPPTGLRPSTSNPEASNSAVRPAFDRPEGRLRIRPKSGPEARFSARKHYCVS